MNDDGLNWMTVRYTIDVDVLADNDEDALYFGELGLPDYLNVESVATTGVVVMR